MLQAICPPVMPASCVAKNSQKYTLKMPRLCSACYSYATQQKGVWWLIHLAMCLVGALLVGVTIVLAVCLVKPLQLKVSIEDARLYSFSIATTQDGATITSTLAYNISLALAVGNPNGASVKFTQPLVAAFAFHDRRIYNITVADKGNMHRWRKKRLHLLKARGVVPPYALDAATLEDFKKQNATGMFKLEVRLSGEINWLHIVFSKKRKLGLSCPLSLQLAPHGPEVVVFRKVSCKLEEQEKIHF
ncbi:unnamed protein product [Alopecurus aequalis]